LLQLTLISSKVNLPRLVASSGRVNGYLEEAGCLVTTDEHICVWVLRVWVGTQKERGKFYSDNK
jgi:hypothetical protein